MSDEDFRTFEKTALAFLKTLDFTPMGYYPYTHCSDVSGYLKPPSPFKIPVKAMAEIVRATPTRPLIEGFHKLAKDSLVERLILICRMPLTDLSSDLQSLVDRLGIEFFDQATISAELQRKKIGKSEVQEYSKLYDLVGAPVLAGGLPDIARQKIPDQMKEHVEKLNLKPWQVFEQAAYSVFHYCFGYTVRKLGEDFLFEREPEGLVVVGGTQPFAMIYECKSKSAEDSYKMTSDHELRYQGYIQDKKEKVQVLEKATLKYFMIIAPEFSGNIKERRENVLRETQVWTVFMPASVLSSFAKWAAELPNDVKILVDFQKIFKLEEDRVSMNTVENYIKKFEAETKPRW